jgi:hypothetical protein
LRTHALAALVAACFALGACNTCDRAPSNAEAWPALPKSDEEARVVFAGIGKRPTSEEDAAFDDEASGALLRAQLVRSGVASGWEAIDAQLARWVNALPDKNVVVAFGTSHDSPAQIDAFRRLVGPRSSIGWTRVLLEQLYADGRWRDVDVATQLGDDAALDRYAKSGSRDDIAALVNRVQRDTYTAWKYGSVDVIGDLIAEARAANRAVSGCDMTPALRARLAPLSEDWIHRMREVHCALAMRDRAKKETSPQRIAALWGRVHAHPDRFPRLVPSDWTSFTVSVLDPPAGNDVVLVDPVLVSSSRLVLASPEGAKHFERKRIKALRVMPPSRFTFTTNKTRRDPVAYIDGERLDGNPDLILRGHHLLTIDKDGTMIAAAIDVPPSGAVEVTVADDPPEVTVTFVDPTAP